MASLPCSITASRGWQFQAKTTLYDPRNPRVHSVLEKSLKMLEFGIKTSRPLKVLENR